MATVTLLLAASAWQQKSQLRTAVSIAKHALSSMHLQRHANCFGMIRARGLATQPMIGVDMDTLAEWLRRRPAKPMGSPRVGSNPTGVAFLPSARSAQMNLRSEVGR